MLSWSDWQKNVLRSLNLECKPFSSSMVKTDLIKRTQKIESMHNRLILMAISWEIFLSQVLSVLLQLYYSGSYFQKLKERHWLNSVRCLSKQTNRNNERGHSAVSTHTITKSLIEISVAPVSFLLWPTVVPIRHQLVCDMYPSTCLTVPK